MYWNETIEWKIQWRLKISGQRLTSSTIPWVHMGFSPVLNLFAVTLLWNTFHVKKEKKSDLSGYDRILSETNGAITCIQVFYRWPDWHKLTS